MTFNMKLRTRNRPRETMKKYGIKQNHSSNSQKKYDQSKQQFPRRNQNYNLRSNKYLNKLIVISDTESQSFGNQNKISNVFMISKKLTRKKRKPLVQLNYNQLSQNLKYCQNIKTAYCKQTKKTVLDLSSKFRIVSYQQYNNSHNKNLYDRHIVQPSRTFSLKNCIVSYTQFLQIETIWVYNEDNQDTTSSETDSSALVVKEAAGGVSLNVHSMKTLSIKNWLNDQVINGYIALINQELNRNNINRHIFHSLFIQSVFNKDKKKILKILRDNKVTNSKQLIFVIHYASHWFFVKVQPIRSRNSQQGCKINIYDSVLKSSIGYYLSIPCLQSLICFCREYYYSSQTNSSKQPIVIRCRDFPQQNNYYDCGVMMLFGIRDTAFGNSHWTIQNLHNKQTVCRRYQLAKELAYQKLCI